MHKSILFFLTCICLFVVGCKASKAASQTPSKPLLLVSIPPYQTLVQQLAGDHFEVRTIAPPNADPHCYEPTAGQITPLLNSELWFRIGEPFERKVLPLLKKTEVLDLRDTIAVVGHDRHLWLSPKHMILQARAIATTLSKRYPSEQGSIATRLTKLEQELNTLDLEVRKRLTTANSRAFIVVHSAFGYFCKEYDCQQLSLEHEGKEARPKELEELVQRIGALRPGVAIALPQHNNKGAQTLAEELRIPVHVVDPYNAEYTDTIRNLAALLANPYERAP